MSTKSRKRSPRPDYKPAAAFPPKKDPPSGGGVWIAIGMIVSVAAVASYYTWGKGHHHAEAPGNAPPAVASTKTGATSSAPNKAAMPTAKSAHDGASQATPSAGDAGTSFEFYRLLPDMKVRDPALDAQDASTAPTKDTLRPSIQDITQPTAPKGTGVTSAGTPPKETAATGNPAKKTSASTAAAPLPSPPAVVYTLQAGAFHTPQEANRMQSRLTGLGLTATIQTVPVAGTTEVWHKVRLGPYPGLDQALQIQQRLRQEGVLSVLSKEHHS